MHVMKVLHSLRVITCVRVKAKVGLERLLSIIHRLMIALSPWPITASGAADD